MNYLLQLRGIEPIDWAAIHRIPLADDGQKKQAHEVCVPSPGKNMPFAIEPDKEARASIDHARIEEQGPWANAAPLISPVEDARPVLTDAMRFGSSLAADGSPYLWKQQWEAIERQQEDGVMAPVTFLGPLCYGAASFPDPTLATDSDRFTTLAALLLSSQTPDIALAHVMNALEFACEPLGGISASAVLQLPTEVLGNSLSEARYPARKATLLTKLAIAVERDGMPCASDIQSLCRLPGIAIKGALLYSMYVGGGEAQGIPVDSNMHRICARLGWTRGAKTAETTQKLLESWLPRQYWDKVYNLFRGFGQVTCSEGKPDCGECELRRQGLCNFEMNSNMRGI